MYSTWVSIYKMPGLILERDPRANEPLIGQLEENKLHLERGMKFLDWFVHHGLRHLHRKTENNFWWELLNIGGYSNLNLLLCCLHYFLIRRDIPFSLQNVDDLKMIIGTGRKLYICQRRWPKERKISFFRAISLEKMVSIVNRYLPKENT